MVMSPILICRMSASINLLSSRGGAARRVLVTHGVGPATTTSRGAMAPIDQLVGREKLGYFSLPSAILAGHSVTCLPSCH